LYLWEDMGDERGDKIMGDAWGYGGAYLWFVQ